MKPNTVVCFFILVYFIGMSTSCTKRNVTKIEHDEQLIENKTDDHGKKDDIVINPFTDKEVYENNPPIDNIEEESDAFLPNPDPLLQAENDASDAGRKVLETGRKMVFDEKVIIRGTCWDYINEVFNRAGFGTNKTVVYRGEKKGPYVDVSEIKPGDWLYYINYSYYGIEHSGIFVYWKDYENKIGVTLSYGGEQRKEPGRYREYDLKSVYFITRPGS
jgi:hypothetical protein